MNRSFLIVLLSVAAVALSGCGAKAYKESLVTKERLSIDAKMFSEHMKASDVNAWAVQAIAEKYKRHGEGPLTVTATYVPTSRQYTATDATRATLNIKHMLRQHGVSNVATNILPVARGGGAEVLLRFDGLVASAPDGCGPMPGMNGAVTEVGSYRLGCGVESLIAMQVANPRDLMGRTAYDGHTDGRRQANIIDGYRSGEQQEPLEGMLASEEE